MSKILGRIYMQHAGTSDATWCADRIHDSDIEYVRAYLLDRCHTTLERLEGELAQCRERSDEWADVEVEMEAQVKKWGVQHHPDGFWHLILAEEVGEIAKAILQHKRGDIEREIVQCAAVCMSWLKDRAHYQGESDGRANT